MSARNSADRTLQTRGRGPARGAQLEPARPRNAIGRLRSDGPELRTMRRAAVAARQPRDEPREGRFRPSPERVARAHVRHDDSCRADAHARAASRAHIRASAAASSAISTGSPHRIRPAPRATRRSPSSRSHWFSTECLGCRSARPVDRPRVHPPPSLDVVADRAAARPARPRQPRAARAAVKVDHEVEPLAPQPPRERTSSATRLHPAACGTTITSSRCGLPVTTGAASRSDEVGQAGFRERPLERPEERRREHHVADETQADQQDLHVRSRR